MGLGEARRKQRLVGSAHTRNAAWSSDATLPGQRLLASMGWSQGQGIGRGKDGMADPVKVAFKMDNRGIGAQRAEREARASGKADAWIGGGGELGSLFERLNQAGTEAKAAAATEATAAAMAEKSSKPSASPLAEGSSSSSSRSGAEAAKKTRKAEKHRRKEDRKAAKDAIAAAEALMPCESNAKVSKSAAAIPPPAMQNPRMAARARYLRAKRMVGQDAASVNEILGIASSSTSGASSPMPVSLAPTAALCSEQELSASKKDEEEVGKRSDKADGKGKRKAEAEGDDAANKRSGEDSVVPPKKSSQKRQRDADENVLGSDDGGAKAIRKSKKDKSTTSDDSGDIARRKQKEKRRAEKKKAKEGAKRSKSKAKTNAAASNSSDSDDMAEAKPASITAPQPSLPPSSDPSFDAPGGGRVSHLSVQEYLQNKLMQRRAAVIRMRRDKETGIWKRAAAAAVGA